MTTVPFARVTSIARLMTACDFVAAVMSVRSAPRPPVSVANQRLERFRHRSRPASRPSAARALDALRIEIEADDVAAGGLQQLRGDLPDQAEAEDGDALAELRRGAADALQRDGADRGRRRERSTRQPGGTRQTRLRLTDHVVGVVRLAGAGAGHQIAGRKIGDPVADRRRLRRPLSSRRPSPACRARSRGRPPIVFGAVPTSTLASVTRDGAARLRWSPPP